MYLCGDQVVYGIHGVCKIADIEDRFVSGKHISYYVLVPLDQPGAQFYVPQHNAVAVAKMRPLLSKAELDALLSSDEIKQDAWIADESRRKQYYKELICSSDRKALLCMVRSLHRQKDIQLTAGRKFHLCDENFLRDAEKLLCSEFSMVLNLPADQVNDYIRTALEI